MQPNLKTPQNHQEGNHTSRCNLVLLNPGAHSDHTLVGFDYWRHTIYMSPLRSAMHAERLGKMQERYSIVLCISLLIFRPEVSPSSPRSLVISFIFLSSVVIA